PDRRASRDADFERAVGGGRSPPASPRACAADRLAGGQAAGECQPSSTPYLVVPQKVLSCCR
ncbi:MAG: hypothetical protein ACK51X_01265, partial [Planctomycetota bacterium]